MKPDDDPLQILNELGVAIGEGGFEAGRSGIGAASALAVTDASP